jgi:hypothetical protein
MADRHGIRAARADPAQWRRHGLTAPEDLAAMVTARLWGPTGPRYSDFFRAETRFR